MKTQPVLFAFVLVFLNSMTFAQEPAKLDMPELVFLKSLKGKWESSGVYIQGVHYKSDFAANQLNFSKEGALLTNKKQAADNTRLLKYEKFNIAKKEIDLFSQNDKKQLYRYSLTLKDEKLYLAIRSSIGEQDKVPENRLPNAKNLAWEFKRIKTEKQAGRGL